MFNLGFDRRTIVIVLVVILFGFIISTSNIFLSKNVIGTI